MGSGAVLEAFGPLAHIDAPGRHVRGLQGRRDHLLGGFWGATFDTFQSFFSSCFFCVFLSCLFGAFALSRVPKVGKKGAKMEPTSTKNLAKRRANKTIHFRREAREMFSPPYLLKHIQINKITNRRTTKRRQPTEENLQNIIQR